MATHAKLMTQFQQVLERAQLLALEAEMRHTKLRAIAQMGVMDEHSLPSSVGRRS